MNKGRKTRHQLSVLIDKDWQKERLLPWLNSLEAFRWTKIGEKDFLLVHAGLLVPAVKAHQAQKPYAHEIARKEPGIMHWLFPPDTPPLYSIAEEVGEQSRDELVWVREKWLARVLELPFDIIHGHTVISENYYKHIVNAGGEPSSWEPGKILHYFGNRHDIDCGCAAGRAPYALGCLRLDDMEEFYVPLK